MENFMRQRVAERVAALGLNPTQAAKAAGLDRYMVSDLLSGKKDMIRPKALAALAPVLQCDPEYLIGAQDTPRAASGGGGAAAPGLTLAGVCEAGVWRAQTPAGVGQALPLLPDPRFDPSRQVAYLVRGGAGEGIRDGDVIVALSGEAARDGDLVIASRSRRAGEIETSVRRLLAGALEILDRPGQSIPADHAEIVGRVIAVHRVF